MKALAQTRIHSYIVKQQEVDGKPPQWLFINLFIQLHLEALITIWFVQLAAVT